MTRTARRPQPKSIGRYTIVAEIEAGSPLGPLWLGRARVEGKDEPCLVRRVTLPEGRELIAQLREACRTGSGSTHGGWLALIGCESDDEELIIASEYREGQLLSSLLTRAGMQRGPAPPEVAARIVCDVLGALRKLHEARDGALAFPSPDSIWVGADGRTALLEPAVNAIAASDPATREHPRVAGYIAPEHPLGGADGDRRADLFASGVVLWEILRNRALFSGGSANLVRERVKHAPIRRVDGASPPGGVPIAAEWADIVERALARDPATRWQSAQAFEAALAPLAAAPERVRDYLLEQCAPDLERQRRLLPAAEQRPAEAVPLHTTRPPSSRESGPPPSSRDVTPSPPRRTLDEALVVDPKSFSPSSQPRDALDSFEMLVAAEGLGESSDPADSGSEPPPESERRVRPAALELDPEPEPLESDHEPPPESGRRLASSAPPESGRRRASGSYLEVPASLAPPPAEAPRRRRSWLFGGVVALVAVVVALLVARERHTSEAPSPAPAALEGQPAAEPIPDAPTQSTADPGGPGDDRAETIEDPAVPENAPPDQAPAPKLEPRKVPTPPAPSKGAGPRPKYTPGGI